MSTEVAAVLLATLATVCRTSPVFPAFDSQTGYIRQCNSENPCPRGMACLNDVFFPEVKTCFSAAAQEPRPGSCPRGGRQGQFGSQRCQFDSTCSAGQKCCQAGGRMRMCMAATPISTQPKVTVLQEGSMKQLSDGFDFVGSVTLVQANGKNILVDSGNAGQKPALTKALQDNGLQYGDIDYIVTSHGHPDHYSTVVPDIPNVFGTFIVTNSKYKFSPLGQKQQYILMPNVEIKETPGHTLQDNSVIVSNTAQGTVAVVGDLFLSEQGASSLAPISAQDIEKAKVSRKATLCAADYIVPGHGAMFRVTDAQRNAMGC